MNLQDLLNSTSNKVQNALGVSRTIDKLIQDKDISKVTTLFQNRDAIVDKAIEEYNPETHKIRFKPDKQRKDKDPKILAKLSGPYQLLINETEVFFMYGSKPTWQQNSTGTDEAYEAFNATLKATRWNTTQRQLKRLAGAETQAAKLYYVYKDEEGKSKVGVKILAKSKGDEIRPLFDQYERMLSFGHGYYLMEGTKSVYHFDIYQDNVIWRCKKLSMGWEVVAEVNVIGKIPVILVIQKEAHYGVQPQIDRVESLRSHISDVNDYFADPTLKMSRDMVQSAKSGGKTGLPDADKAGGGKVAVLPSKESVFEYLTVEAAVDLKKEEVSDLMECINILSMTPDLSFKALAAAGAPTGRALKRAMALGYMKRALNMETYDLAHEREISIIKAIIAKVTDISLKSEMENLDVSCHLSEPFDDDISEKVSDIIKLYEAGLISQETAVSLVEYIDNPTTEMEKILEDAKRKLKEQMDQRGSMFREPERGEEDNEA